MQGMLRAVEETGRFNVVFMSLGHNKVRKRYQLVREIKFLKEYATAKWVFTTEALATVGGFRKRQGTYVTNLWHGCGAFKKFGLSTAAYRFGSNLETKKKYPDYRNTDLITVSSPDVVWAYEEAMDYNDADVVYASGISRTDIFYDKDYVSKAKDRVAASLPFLNGRKIILYAPTFRGRVKTAYAPDSLDLRMMKEAIGDDYVMVIKQHPHVKERPEVPEDCRDFAADVTGELTIDDLICASDICISDYSSMVFEYSLFGRPMIFYADDLEDYNDWRGFYYSYEELTPGPVVDTTEDVIDYIANLDKRFDRDEVEAFRYRFMRSCDGHATERIMKRAGMI
jgi:CDP-ribitol ribitolphosphotransferase